jgi:hypothetical protein
MGFEPGPAVSNISARSQPFTASGAACCSHNKEVLELLRPALRRIESSPYRPYYPALTVLVSVALFWAVGNLGGLALLHDARSPVVTLAWLYLMLFLIVCSAVAAAVAVLDVVRRIRNRHS